MTASRQDGLPCPGWDELWALKDDFLLLGAVGHVPAPHLPPGQGRGTDAYMLGVPSFFHLPATARPSPCERSRDPGEGS